MPNKQQMNKLKELNKVECIKCENISESDMKIYEYLKSLGYVKIEYDSFTCLNENKKMVTFQTEPLSVSIDEPGKDYLASEKSRKREKWIPISISFLALLKSYGIIDKLIALCRQLLELLSQSE